MDREYRALGPQDETQHDVIIIGSGISALTTGAILSRLGRRVTILEQHHLPGGATHVFGKKGFEWNTGLHYLGDVHLPGHPLRRIFDFLSDNTLKWSPSPAVYDRLIFPEATVSLRPGKEAFCEEILKFFPREEKGLKDYLLLLQRVKEFTRSYSGTRVFPQLGFLMDKNKFSRFFQRTTREVLGEIFQDQRVIGVLCGQFGNYGLAPDQSSFGVHALVAWHYLHGSSFPVGGSGEIARTLIRSIRSRGGEVFIRSEVEEILTEKGRATGVRLSRGQKLSARTVISTAGLAVTEEKLLGGNPRPRVKGPGHLSIALGIESELKDFSYDGANLWLHPSFDISENVANYFSGASARPAVSYVSFPCLKDPTWESRVGKNLSVDILGLVPLEWFSQWSDSRHKRRPQEYEEFKQELARPYLENFLALFPELQGKLSVADVSTPLTTRHYLGSSLGEVYGPAAVPGRFELADRGPRSQIKGLYLAGQDTLFHGVYGALVSGVLCACAIHPLGTVREVLPTGIFET